jgi:hemin uptake protein HemP
MIQVDMHPRLIESPGHAVTHSSPAATPPVPPIIYSSAELLQGRREVWIEHGDQMYRLRVTSAKKLYLTK